MISLRDGMFLFLENGDLTPIHQFPFQMFLDEKPVYEVIKYKKGLLYFNDHLRRLENSLKQIGVESTSKFLLKQEEIENLFHKNEVEEGNIRIDVFVEHKTVIAYLIPHFYPPTALYQSGVSLVFQHAERPHQEIKIFHSEIKDHTQQLLKNSQAFETLLVNRNDEITEGSRSNIFFIKESMVFTPPDFQVLQGITRNKIIDFLESNKIILVKKTITTSEMQEFESAFITGTSIGALTVNQIEYQLFNTTQALLLKIIKEYNNIEF